MYQRITYSSPEEYSKLSFWEAKHAEYKPSAAYWHRRREATILRKPAVQDEIEQDEIGTMLTQLMQEHVQRISRLSDQEVSSVYTELKEVFAMINVQFDELPCKYSYLSLFRSFAKTKGIEVKEAIQQLQRRFKGNFRIYFNDAYEFIEILTGKYNRFILQSN